MKETTLQMNLEDNQILQFFLKNLSEFGPWIVYG